MLAFWFEGIELPVAGEPPVAVLPDCPSLLEDRFRAATELGRSAAMGKIHWRDVGSYLQELRGCPSHLVVKKDKVQVVRDWSNAPYPLNTFLVKSPSQYGAIDDFLRMSASEIVSFIGWWPRRAAAIWVPGI